jgi:Gas vesicle synthesis protein GvpL/GvpF
MAMTEERSRLRQEAETALYVYGITWSGGAAGRRGAGVVGADVEIVEHGELAAIVSPVPDGGVRAKRRDLLLHMEVLQKAFDSQPVLPLRFGTVLRGATNVIDDLLAPRYEEFVALLHSVDGLAELRVCATYVEGAILAEIVEADSQIARLRELTRAAGADADPLRVQLGEAVARALAVRREHDLRALTAELIPRSRDAVVEDPRSELELLRASFLVDRGEIAGFDARMNELARTTEGKLTFTYTGPLPPHSFVSLSTGARQ